MPDARRPRILIVDDREENRYVLFRVLQQAGYDCTEIASGAQALKAAQTLPDLMVLDASGTTFEVFLPVGGVLNGYHPEET